MTLTPATSQPIREGDLAVIVKPSPCCGNTKSIGRIFRAGRIEFREQPCMWCGIQRATTIAEVSEAWIVDLNRCKRIPPLSELDDVKQDETIHA